MHLFRPALLLVTVFLVPTVLWPQFTEPFTFGGSGNENGYQLVSDQEGGFFLAGTLDAAYAPLGTPLPMYGEEDFLLGRMNGSGEWQWVKSGGSFLDDEVRVMRRMPDGGILVAGTFWLEFTYDDLTLETTDNIEGIFLVRINADGSWQWGKVINGTNLKGINDVKIGAAGEIYLTGYFAEGLSFEDLELQATGKNDAFLLELNSDGILQHWQQLGFKGTTRGQTIALHPNGGYYWGGVYDDTLRVDTTELYANTFDRDVFLARFDGDGNPLWARRAGGVFEEELIAMEADASGDLLATGFLIGVMTLSEAISVQSRNGIPDIFLFRYNDAGEALWARSIGGELIDLPTDLLLRGDELLIGGTYQQRVAWDGLSSSVTAGVNGFVAGFDAATGAGSWLATVSTDEFAFVRALELDADDRLFALGSFSGVASMGSFSISSPEQYDMFLTQVDPALTATFEPETFPGLRIFPNPVQDMLLLRAATDQLVTVRIVDAQGRVRWTGRDRLLSTPVNVSNLEAGSYWLVIYRDNKFTTKAFSIAGH